MFKDLKTDYYSTLDSVEKEEWDIFFRKKLRYKQPKLMTQKQINEIKEAERQQQEMGFEESNQQDRDNAEGGFGFDQGFTNPGFNSDGGSQETLQQTGSSIEPPKSGGLVETLQVHAESLSGNSKTVANGIIDSISIFKRANEIIRLKKAQCTDEELIYTIKKYGFTLTGLSASLLAGGIFLQSIGWSVLLPYSSWYLGTALTTASGVAAILKPEIVNQLVYKRKSSSPKVQMAELKNPIFSPFVKDGNIDGGSLIDKDTGEFLFDYPKVNQESNGFISEVKDESDDGFMFNAEPEYQDVEVVESTHEIEHSRSLQGIDEFPYYPGSYDKMREHCIRFIEKFAYEAKNSPYGKAEIPPDRIGILESNKDLLFKMTPDFADMKELPQDSNEFKNLVFYTFRGFVNSALKGSKIGNSDKFEVYSIRASKVAYEIEFYVFDKANYKDLTRPDVLNTISQQFIDYTANKIEPVSIVPREKDNGRMVYRFIRQEKNVFVSIADIMSHTKANTPPEKSTYHYFFKDQSFKAYPMAVGYGASDNAILCDFFDNVAGLIAGTTGSGKTWAVVSVLAQMIMQSSPGDLQIVVIDPKRTKLMRLLSYLPHCIAYDDASDPLRLHALFESIKRMFESRLTFMGDMLGVDNIKDFLEAEKDNPKQRRQFPPVLIIIDEVPNFLSIINQVPERLKKMPEEDKQELGYDKFTTNDTKDLISKLTSIVRSGGGRFIFIAQRTTDKFLPLDWGANAQFHILMKMQGKDFEKMDVDNASTYPSGKGEALFTSEGQTSHEFIKTVTNGVTNDFELNLLFETLALRWQYSVTEKDFIPYPDLQEFDVRYERRKEIFLSHSRDMWFTPTFALSLRRNAVFHIRNQTGNEEPTEREILDAMKEIHQNETPDNEEISKFLANLERQMDEEEGNSPEEELTVFLGKKDKHNSNQQEENKVFVPTFNQPLDEDRNTNSSEGISLEKAETEQDNQLNSVEEDSTDDLEALFSDVNTYTRSEKRKVDHANSLSLTEEKVNVLKDVGDDEHVETKPTIDSLPLYEQSMLTDPNFNHIERVVRLIGSVGKSASFNNETVFYMKKQVLNTKYPFIQEDIQDAIDAKYCKRARIRDTEIVLVTSPVYKEVINKVMRINKAKI